MVKMSMDRSVARASRPGMGVVRSLALLLLLWMGFAGSVSAACSSPQTAHIASGGRATFTCAQGGFVLVSGPHHGTVDTDPPDDPFSMTYTNNGDGALSDTFAATDETSQSITFNITIDPPAGALTVTPDALPTMTFNQTYPGASLSTSGGTSPYTYSVPGGGLPPGIAVSSSGVVSGKPTAVGPYNFTVHVADSASHTVDKAYSVTIADPTLTVTPTTLPAAQQNRAYPGQQLATNGGTAPYAYVVDSGSSLPPGLAMSGTGNISGTPTVAGNFSFTVNVTDSTPRSSGTRPVTSQLIAIQIAAAPTITVAPATLPNGTYRTTYPTQTVTASGGTAPYTFSSTGTLPPGVTLDQGGALSGMPTAAGTFNFTVSATDANAFVGAQPYTVTIAATRPAAPTGVSATADSGAVGTQGAASVSFAAPADNGGSAITGYTVTSSPGNVTATGPGAPVTVSGLTRGTAYTFTVTATNSAGTSDPSASSASVTPRVADSVTFANPGPQNFGGPLILSATAASGRSVTWASTTPAVCTINASSGQVTDVSAGMCSITASVPGDGTYDAASQSQTFQVNAVAPGAPTIGSATTSPAPANQATGTATVSFTPPASNGGSPITQYTVTSVPGGFTGTGPSSSIVVTGLTFGTPYSFNVKATNAENQQSVASANSNAVTPTRQQTITLQNPGTVDFGTTTPLNVSSTSGLPVTVTSSTPTCHIVATNQLQAVAPGNCTIQATQNGGGGFEPATPVQQTFLVRVPGGAVSINTASLPPATRGVPYSQTIVASGGAQPYTFANAGALPNGLVLNPASGTISGVVTSTVSTAFDVQVTDQAGQQATRSFTIAVVTPGFTFTPATLPAGKVGAAYASTSFSVSGGIAPYTYTVDTGVLPDGLRLDGGTISGTPTQAGNSPVTIKATDSYGATGSQSYTISVGEATPVAVDESFGIGANTAGTFPVTAHHTGGPVTSVTVSQAPAHGTATVSGLNVVYTPAHDFFGTDTFRYTATGPGGTSNPATVTVTVAAGAVPTVVAHKATVLAGKPVTIAGAEGAGNGPFTAATVVAAPSSGNVQVQGTDFVYTPAEDASGDVTFTYTLSNAFGASQPATVTVTVNAMPVAPPVSTTALAGRHVRVNLSAAARGGPFTAASVVSVSPSTAGAASIENAAEGYVLVFNAAPTFGGMVQIGYTLTNAYATSAPGYVSVTVTARPDPSKDPEVLGVLSAQADATRRMAVGQISNFQRRLEVLHSGGANGFTNGITVASAGSGRGKDAYATLRNAQDDASRRYLVQPDADSVASTANATSQHGTLPGDVSVWTGGAVNFGRSQAGTASNGTDFTTSGLSFGVDKQFSDKLALGAGVGYGHDNTDVGNNGSRSAVDSYNVALYGSYHPSESFYTDALIGYQWLSFDSYRHITGNDNRVTGSRDGKQWFASLSAGYNHVGDNSQLTPYGRFDIAHGRLDGYTEHGDDVYSLAYQSQTVKTATATLGVLAQWSVKRDYGIWAPQLRAEFGHDMQGSSSAAMRYADVLDGPLYRATLYRQSRNHTLLGAGIALQTNGGWMLRAEYQNQLDNTSRDNQSILLGVEKKFGP